MQELSMTECLINFGFWLLSVLNGWQFIGLITGF